MNDREATLYRNGTSSMISGEYFLVFDKKIDVCLNVILCRFVTVYNR